MARWLIYILLGWCGAAANKSGVLEGMIAGLRQTGQTPILPAAPACFCRQEAIELPPGNRKG